MNKFSKLTLFTFIICSSLILSADTTSNIRGKVVNSSGDSVSNADIVLTYAGSLIPEIPQGLPPAEHPPVWHSNCDPTQVGQTTQNDVMICYVMYALMYACMHACHVMSCHVM